MMGQAGRGSRLEGTLTRLIRLNPFVRILGLSATMPNTDELSDWLQGVSFSSQWRRVPLDTKIVRFKAAKDKPELLLCQVRRCIDGGGQSLVFCSSRSRVQALAQYLRENGISAECHHAGLLSSERTATEARFKSGDIRVLTATSTLEMGINLPARQVVIYDSYSFSDRGFVPLPVWSFIQRAGRAGRPGLDAHGEAILMLPRWSGDSEKYLRGACERVSSTLASPRAMQEQILIEVFAGYSRTREELSGGFLPLTLYKKQHPEASLNGTINQLIMTGLLTKQIENDAASERPALRCGLLGRLAVKLMLSPDSVSLIRDAYLNAGRLYIFDILLVAALTEDCSPLLPASLEEMDNLCACVQRLQSALLDLSAAQLKKKFPAFPGTSRILAGIKMAAICHTLTTGIGAERIAERYDVYAADVRMLQESVIRILMGITAITSAIDKSGPDAETIREKSKDLSHAPGLSAMLVNMLQYEIDSKLVSLTRLKGVGGKTAKRLAAAGYTTLGSIAAANSDALSRIPGVGKKLAAAMVMQAQELLRNGEDVIYEEPAYAPAGESRSIKAKIDPYRLRRSLELSIRGCDGTKYIVAGGREDHVVFVKEGKFICDCRDFEKNGSGCKHILCVRRSLNEPAICKMVKRMREDKNHSIREALPSLWYAAAEKGKEL